MVYPNYYARRLTAQTAWRRPTSVWGNRRSGYGYRPGASGWQAGRQIGARPGYPWTGGYAARYGPRYGAAPRSRWNWLRRMGQGYGYSPQTYGDSRPAMGVAPQGPVGSAPQPGMAPQWIAWAQSCLAQAVGPGVPHNGVMGRATRHAIRKFQKQQQLPVTGMLDASTINALQAACSGQAGAPAAPQGAPAGDDVAAATAAASGGGPPAPPDAGSAPPDAPPPPDASAAGPPPDAPSGEVSRGGRRRRHRRRWGSGFNFQQAPQPPDGDDDGEFFMGGGGRMMRRGWGAGYQQPDEDDGSSYRWRRRR
jgi:peptidoglycan hydrolase-like protein with peptidoglycan-binding domain